MTGNTLTESEAQHSAGNRMFLTSQRPGVRVTRTSLNYDPIQTRGVTIPQGNIVFGARTLDTPFGTAVVILVEDFQVLSGFNLLDTNWFVQAYKKIHSEFPLLEKDWNGFGSEPPNKIAIALAEKVLGVLRDRDMEPHMVVASADDGIAFSFRRGEGYANIECLNSGEIYSLRFNKDTEPTTIALGDDEESIREAISLISAFIAR